MPHWLDNPTAELLTDRPLLSFQTEQLDLFNLQSIHAQEVRKLDIAKSVSRLTEQQGKRVLGSDFGGDKGIVRLFEVINGSLMLVDDYADDIQGNDGEGYLACIEKAASYAESQSIPFGISWGGPIKGTVLEYHPKAKIFMQKIQAKYQSDLANISPAVTACLNDGPAGLLKGALAAYTKHQATNIFFIINGGGIGLGVLANGSMFATEAGHVEGIDALNSYQQSSKCGLFGATYTCLEHLGANKAGIEVQWQQLHNGEYLRAIDIEARYKEGDKLAAELYDHSALIVAHIIEGAAQAFSVNVHSSETIVVGHGGAFKFPGYGERIAHLLAGVQNKPLKLIMTKDFTDPNSNACLEGAAFAAITAN